MQDDKTAGRDDELLGAKTMRYSQKRLSAEHMHKFYGDWPLAKSHNKQASPVDEPRRAPPLAGAQGAIVGVESTRERLRPVAEEERELPVEAAAPQARWMRGRTKQAGVGRAGEERGMFLQTLALDHEWPYILCGTDDDVYAVMATK